MPSLFGVLCAFVLCGVLLSSGVRACTDSCSFPILNQGSCGSCWAFASSATYSINMCKGSGAATQLSPVAMAECKLPTTNSGFTSKFWFQTGSLTSYSYSIPPLSPSNNACYGNTLFFADRIMKTVESVGTDCVPYSANYYVPSLPSCRATCSTTGASIASMAKATAPMVVLYNQGQAQAISDMKAALDKFGALVVAVAVTNSFTTSNPGSRVWGTMSSDYDMGSNNANYAGGHAMTVIGYTNTYWIVQNSWGAAWGVGGVYYLAMGISQSTCSSGLAWHPECVGSMLYYWNPTLAAPLDNAPHVRDVGRGATMSTWETATLVPGAPVDVTAACGALANATVALHNAQFGTELRADMATRCMSQVCVGGEGEV